VRYVRDLNLNTIRYEGKFEDERMFELTDAYGLLVMIGWNCCDAWQQTGSWNAEQKSIGNESLRSLMYRLRNHPSMLVWLNGSDVAPASGVEQSFLNIEAALQWPNPILNSAAATSTSLSGSTGVKMAGPYEWEPPLYWETDSSRQGGGAWGFATEISPGPAVPPLDSLVKFIPADHLWPIDSFWTYHCGGGPFSNLNVFTTALNNRYGASVSAAEYAEKAQVAAYESHRAMFEAYGRKKYGAGGVIQWMMRNAWPSMIWHLYDYYLRPGGSYYGSKNALEPLHIQYSYADRAIVVVNSTLQSFAGLRATARVYNLDGTKKYDNTLALGSVGPDGVVTAFNVPALSGLSRTHFLRLVLTDAGNAVVSLQTYWLSTKSDALAWDQTEWFKTPQSAYADFTGLSSLPAVHVAFTERMVDTGDQRAHIVTVTNTSSAIAFFTHLKITKGVGGEELLPILWQDNYFTLLPGESRELKASYSIAALGGATPAVAIDTYNDL
jgi:exo-1,4-beta-D-glucosaminidase